MSLYLAAIAVVDTIILALGTLIEIYQNWCVDEGITRLNTSFV